MSNISENLFKNKRTYNEDFLKRGLDQINLSQFIINWSIKYPFDRLWREKYNIKFNSPVHRETNIVDMLIDLGQDSLYKNLKPTKHKYLPNRGEYFKLKRSIDISEQLSEEDIQEAFDNLDIENLQYDEEGKIII